MNGMHQWKVPAILSEKPPATQAIQLCREVDKMFPSFQNIFLIYVSKIQEQKMRSATWNDFLLKFSICLTCGE